MAKYTEENSPNTALTSVIHGNFVRNTESKYLPNKVKPTKVVII